MVIFVSGGKGGVGKSLVAMAALNSAIQDKQEPILIDTDTANPDVFKSYNGKLPTENAAFMYDLDKEKGWEKVLTLIAEIAEKSPERPIVVNAGARNQAAMAEYGAILNEIPGEFKTLWVINTQLDGLILLKDYLQVVKQPVCVVKNLFFGDDEDFATFHESKLATEAKIKSVNFPKAPKSLTDALTIKRRAIHDVNEILTFGEKMLAKNWLVNADKSIRTAIELAEKSEK